MLCIQIWQSQQFTSILKYCKPLMASESRRCSHRSPFSLVSYDLGDVWQWLQSCAVELNFHLKCTFNLTFGARLNNRMFTHELKWKVWDDFGGAKYAASLSECQLIALSCVRTAFPSKALPCWAHQATSIHQHQILLQHYHCLALLSTGSVRWTNNGNKEQLNASIFQMATNPLSSSSFSISIWQCSL